MALDTNSAINSVVPSTASTPSSPQASNTASSAPESHGSAQAAQQTEKAVATNASTDATSAVTPPQTEGVSKAEEKKAEDKLSPKFAALTRKEREIQSQTQKLKTEQAKIGEARTKMEAEIASERAKISEDVKKVQEFESLKKMNPLKAFEALGFTYQQLTDIVLNEGKPTPEMEMSRLQSEMDAKLEAYKKEQSDERAKLTRESEERQKKELEEQQAKLKAQEAEYIAEFQKSIEDFVATNADSYEFITVNEQVPLVFATVERHYEETGKVLTIKEAADLVEQFLEKRVEQNLATKKLKAKVSPPSSPKEDIQANPKTTQAIPSQAPKTLTNSMTASSVSSPALSERERIQRALNRLS